MVHCGAPGGCAARVCEEHDYACQHQDETQTRCCRRQYCGAHQVENMWRGFAVASCADEDSQLMDDGYSSPAIWCHEHRGDLKKRTTFHTDGSDADGR